MWQRLQGKATKDMMYKYYQHKYKASYKNACRCITTEYYVWYSDSWQGHCHHNLIINLQRPNGNIMVLWNINSYKSRTNVMLLHSHNCECLWLLEVMFHLNNYFWSCKTTCNHGIHVCMNYIISYVKNAGKKWHCW